MSGGRTDPVGRCFRKLAHVAVVAAVLLPSVVYALDDNQVIKPAAGAKPAAPSIGAGGTLNFLTLVIALALAAAGAWLFWRNRRAPGIRREGRLLAIDETRSLGNRQYLVVASYENKKFLLGVCPGRIDLLAPLHDGKDREGGR